MKVKILFFVLLFASAIGANAQAPGRDLATNKYTYQNVVQVDSATPAVLFQRATSWYEQEFKTAQLNLKNSTDGKLAHTGSFPVKWTFKKYVQEVQIIYTVSIECRDGRYRYTFTDFRVSNSVNATTTSQTLEAEYDYEPPVGKKNHDDMMAQILASVDAHITKCIADLAVDHVRRCIRRKMVILHSLAMAHQNVGTVIDPPDTRMWISLGIEAASQAPATRAFNMGVLQT